MIAFLKLPLRTFFPCATYTILNLSPANIFFYFFLMMFKNIQCDSSNIQFQVGDILTDNTHCAILAQMPIHMTKSYKMHNISTWFQGNRTTSKYRM